MQEMISKHASACVRAGIWVRASYLALASPLPGRLAVSLWPTSNPFPPPPSVTPSLSPTAGVAWRRREHEWRAFREARTSLSQDGVGRCRTPRDLWRRCLIALSAFSLDIRLLRVIMILRHHVWNHLLRLCRMRPMQPTTILHLVARLLPAPVALLRPWQRAAGAHLGRGVSCFAPA